MALFPPAAKPKSLLGYHRLLSPTAGVRVSPLCLGAMNFGDAWKGYLGECNKQTAFQMMDFFYEQGGNFIDTANNYQNQESETWIGEWMAGKKNRDELVLATKFTTGFVQEGHIKSNFQGNHAKSIKVSVDRSLEKLRTDYIDLLWLHWWDYTTSIPELMNSLHNLVINGKVLYLGISDTPAWIVVKCNEYARHHGLTQFSVYQGWYSAAMRDLERDVIPMCQAEGMGLAPWGALGRGQFKAPEEFNKEDREGRKGQQSENVIKMASKLQEMAKKKDTQITSIALAYVMQKTPYVFPIVGGRKVEHLKGNIEALAVKLSQEELADIDSAVPFDPGFPNNFLFGGRDKFSTRSRTEDIYLVEANSWIETVPKPTPIQPGEGAQRAEKVHSS